MSAQEIIEQLDKLTPTELEQIRRQVEALSASRTEKRRTIGEALLEHAGTVDDLPEDASTNHDHYLYGAAKRQG